MKKNQINKRLLFPGISLLICFSIAAFLFVKNASPREEIKAYLLKQLTIRESLRDTTGTQRSVIYVLGGTEQSLENRFKTAAELYRHRASKKILILSQPGITAFDGELHRNLTNDEWAVKQLTRLGVKLRDIEPVMFEKSLLGTLTEAEGLSELAANRGYCQVILVTSRYHTKRTWITFIKAFENRNISIAIYPSNDPAGLKSLSYEWLKLVFYKNIILPIYTKTKSVIAFRCNPILSPCSGTVSDGDP